MTHPRDYQLVLDRVGVALEATCDALMTLQSIERLSSTSENGHEKGHVAEAISHLHHAIDELRNAHAQGQTGLALGFVLERDERDSRDDAEPG